jgi:hypothetical protein
MNLGSIQSLYSHTGPYVTVHLDVSRDSEDADHQIETRWGKLRQELDEAGIDRELSDAIGERLLTPTGFPGEVRRTLVATDGEIVFDDLLTGHAPWPESTGVGPLPDLTGWLRHADGQLPFLLVLADREGADIDLYRAQSRPRTEHEEVHGDTLHIHKVPLGDPAEKEFQQRSENVWKHNAREVAEAVRSQVGAHKPRVVVLAGDERARTEIEGDLRSLQTPVEQVASGGRAAGSSEESLWQDVSLLLARLEAEDHESVASRLSERVGQRSGAARGLADVLDALAQGKVERLVVDLEAARELTVDPSQHPGLSLPPAASKETGLPADQVLVAAGAATDAAISVLPQELIGSEGVAALLRWDD